MPRQLSERPEDKVLSLLESEWGSVTPSVNGYTAVYNDADGVLDSKEFIISANWPAGDSYPFISVTNRDANVQDGGNTGITGIQGNGSGSNQHNLETMNLTVHVEKGDYDGTRADDFAFALIQHAKNIIWDNQNAPNDSEIWAYYAQDVTHSLPNQDSTDITHQEQTTVAVEWLKTP